MGIGQIARIFGKTLFSGNKGVKLIACMCTCAVAGGGLAIFNYKNNKLRQITPKDFSTSDTTYYKGTSQPSSIEYRYGDKGRVENFYPDGSSKGYAEYRISNGGDCYEYQYHEPDGLLSTWFSQLRKNGEIIDTDYMDSTIYRYNAETKEVLGVERLK